MFNISTRRVGGLRFVKIGRLTFSFCISRQYRPFGQRQASRRRCGGAGPAAGAGLVRQAMQTFAFLLLLTFAGPGDDVASESHVLDTGLTMADCLAAWAAFDPAASELPNGLTVYINPVCEAENLPD